MKKYAFILVASLTFSAQSFAQEIKPDLSLAKAYLFGPGDEITVKVSGEAEFDFIATVGEDGKVEVPFSEDTLIAKCKTQVQLKAEIKELLSKYLRRPMFNMTFKANRPPVAIYGEVRNPEPVVLMRKATIVEVLAFSGGVTEDAGGLIQVFRTQPAVCADPSEDSDWKNKDTPTDVPSKLFSLANIRAGREEANTIIYPGDVIWVRRASPVYVNGEVVNPQGVYIKEDGLTLTEAIAKLGGVRREASTKDIKIYRLKPNSKDRDIIAVNYDLIKKGEQKDVMLEPYDVIEVGKARQSIGKTILDIAVGAAKTTVSSFSGGVGYRVLY
jgi:polysaccharide export outer membrane protein